MIPTGLDISRLIRVSLKRADSFAGVEKVEDIDGRRKDLLTADPPNEIGVEVHFGRPGISTELSLPEILKNGITVTADIRLRSSGSIGVGDHGSVATR